MDELFAYEDVGVELDDRETHIMNTYLETTEKITTDPEAALSGFAHVVRISPDHPNWCFEALRQIVQIYCTQGEHEKLKDAYREMLKPIKSYFRFQSIDNTIDLVSSSFSHNLDLLEEIYQATLETLVEINSELWFKTNLRLCDILFARAKHLQISKILKELHKSCQKEDGTYAKHKASKVFEIYANELLLYTETKDNKDLKMQQLYRKAVAGNFGRCDPRFVGRFRECGGKMHMAERQWEEAAIDFRTAFLKYHMVANQRRINCLKYGLLAKMMGSKVNPFDQEKAQPFEDDPEILAMKALIEAYQKNDLAEFETILNSNCMDDPYIKTFMEDQDILKKVRTQALLNLIKPNITIGIRFISKKLGVSETEVTELLRSLILDSRIDGSIDGVNGNLLIGDSANVKKLQPS